MKLFSPQKPGNDGLVKHTIKKGKITVGPLAWMDPRKKTTFVVAKNNADYKAGKFIAKCVTKDRRTVGVIKGPYKKPAAESPFDSSPTFTTPDI